MEDLKPTSKSGNGLKQPNAGRRSFMWKIGAAMSAVLASAIPAMSRPRVNNDVNLKAKVDHLSGRLGILEDENAIRRLHRTYETLLHNGMYQEVVDLFADDGEVSYNGGFFNSRD